MVGSILSSRYELTENIGAGGMAFVYKARCRLLNRYVAVKVLRPEFQEDEEFLKRFTIEAQAAASLSHQNVVSVYDVGHHGKLSYIVMECIEGITLKEYMKRKGVLSQNEALDFTRQIASALEHAHSKGIIHRDIKPHNIIITNEGVLKVTDFGLARAVSGSTNVAGTGGAIGSVHYASPEQAKGVYTDERSDIYSLGVVMYEMFTGQLPFDGETPVNVAMKHINEAPVPPSQLNPQISPEIEGFILRCMAKDVKERFPSVTALLEEMHLLLGTPAPIAHTDKFSTKKLPKLEMGEELTEIEKPAGKKTAKKEDKIAILAAIGVSLVIVAIFVFITMRILFPNGGKQMEVPALYNMSVEAARQKFSNLTIEEIGSGYSSTIPEGYIMEQDKEVGTKLSAGETISVTVSRGARKIELSDYTGEDYRRIERELKELGLVPQISEENSDEVDAGDIIRTNPNAGYELRTGDTVVIYVSRGKSDVEVAVPSIIGLSESRAREVLKQNDLSVGNVTEEKSTKEQGTVIRQAIESGTMISSGTAIDIVISGGAGESAAQMGTHTLRLDIPQDKDTATVKIIKGSKTLFEGTFETALSPITIHLRDQIGSGVVNIYLDDVLYRENVSVTFE